MSYIVCRNCKKFVKVNETAPLVFDKCENCGHTLEFAVDGRELQLILKGIEIPQISYHKICASCKSINPREAGVCLFCGSANFNLQYDLDSINKYKESLNLGQMSFPQEISSDEVVTTSLSNKGLYKILAVVLGIIDFFFIATIGLGLVIGNDTIPADVVGFINQNFSVLSLILVLALLISGFLAVFVLPKMTYRDSFKLSSVIGVIIGLLTLLVYRDITVIIIAVIGCAILTGIGGVLAEVIVHKVSGKLFGR